MKMKSLRCVQLLATSWTTAYQARPSMGFSRQEYWSGVPLPSPETTAFKGSCWKMSECYGLLSAAVSKIF